MILVSLGVPTAPWDGSPKNHVFVMSSLNGELVNDPPARIIVIAQKPIRAGFHKNDQPSKGPG